MNRRGMLKLALAGVSATAMRPRPGLTEGLFARPIKLIVPFEPGGLLDVVARLWAASARQSLGTIVVENVSGGGGTIGVASVARAAPDGYTVLLGNSSTQIVTPLAMSRLPYDAAKDFAAVSILCVSTTCIAVSPSLPVKDLKGLIAYGKANPGRLTYGSAGAGSMTNLAGEIFKHLTGLSDIVHAPYKGMAPALSDVLGGQIPMITPNVTGQLLAYHHDGRIRILSVNAPKRLTAVPDLPTSAEAGLPGMELQVFNGLFVRSGTAAPMISKYSAAAEQVKQNLDFRDGLDKSGFEDAPAGNAAEAQRTVDREMVRLSRLVKDINFRAG